MGTGNLCLLDRDAKPAAADTSVIAARIWRPGGEQKRGLGNGYGAVLGAEIKEKL